MQVELYSCFRPGDLVRAEVVGLGDARSYYLSTAKNELGVVHAQSAAGGACGMCACTLVSLSLLSCMHHAGAAAHAKHAWL